MFGICREMEKDVTTSGNRTDYHVEDKELDNCYTDFRNNIRKKDCFPHYCYRDISFEEFLDYYKRSLRNGIYPQLLL